MKRAILAALLVATIGLAACDDTSSGSASTTLAGDQGDVVETVAAVQAQVADLAQDIQNSPAADQLGDAWATLQADVASATAAVQDTGSVDGTELQQGIETFQSTLDSLGEEAGAEVQAGWTELRGLLNGLVS